MQRPELLGRLPRPAIWARQYSRAFVDTLDQLTLEQDKDVWLEKSPGHLQVAGRVIRPDETWKAATFKTIGGESGSKFRTLLDAEQQQYVLARLPTALSDS